MKMALMICTLLLGIGSASAGCYQVGVNQWGGAHMRCDPGTPVNPSWIQQPSGPPAHAGGWGNGGNSGSFWHPRGAARQELNWQGRPTGRSLNQRSCGPLYSAPGRRVSGLYSVVEIGRGEPRWCH
ncbi:hypothetical protein FJY94_02425 [Candidatus Kaiserbacteria bacterium]|nr:hypothetical protein [Candidatus Kaiserbacteria bacterium]